jgi:hypothetical protein
MVRDRRRTTIGEGRPALSLVLIVLAATTGCERAADRLLSPMTAALGRRRKSARGPTNDSFLGRE